MKTTVLILDLEVFFSLVKFTEKNRTTPLGELGVLAVSFCAASISAFVDDEDTSHVVLRECLGLMGDVV